MREAAGACQSFARKPEPDWGTEIEDGQAVDEQWVVFVGGLPNNGPQKWTQLLSERVGFHISVGDALGDRLSGVRGGFVCENIAKRNLKSARGASAASVPIAECSERQITEHVLTNGFRREVEQLANVEEGERPESIIRCEPAVGIEIKFSVNRASRAMEPMQILPGLLENSGGQFCLARLG